MQKSVLTISNEASVRDMLANLFTDAGYRVSLAGSGAEAVKIVSNSVPVITSYSIHYTKLYEPPS